MFALLYNHGTAQGTVPNKRQSVGFTSFLFLTRPFVGAPLPRVRPCVICLTAFSLEDFLALCYNLLMLGGSKAQEDSAILKLVPACALPAMLN